MNNNFSIENFLDLSEYTTDIRTARRKGSGGSQEFFTPYSIVKKMGDKVPEETWSDPEKTFLEPSMGNGQFVCYIIWKRIQHGVDPYKVLETTYGVELMADNVKECKQRILDLFRNMDIQIDRNKAMKIMNNNLVCSDFFEWNFEEWKPIKPAEPLQMTLEF